MIPIAAVVLIIVISFVAYTKISRIGKTEVTVNIAPLTAQLYIDNEEGGGGVNYLKPGKYTFVAKKKGFADAEVVVDVGTNSQSVDLLLVPNSPEGRKYLDENPEERRAYENLTSEIAKKKGKEMRGNAPIISQLPHTDLVGPFSIDYGPNLEEPGQVTLIVSNSTPAGRLAALQWIKDQGQNPSEINIVYSDFLSPLTEPGKGGD